MLEQITPLLITYNEAPNIRRTIEKLLWARRIVVIDSGSTDETVGILHAYPQIEAIQHPFADFASQCNFGLQQIRTPWVLSLDADYVLSDRLIAEIGGLAGSEAVAGYRTRFIYCVYGRPLRRTLYPPRVVLYRRDKAQYHNEGHGHRIAVDGTVSALAGVICHDDRKPLRRWLTSQQRYAAEEARYLVATPVEKLRRSDRIRRMAWPAPLAVLPYTLLGLHPRRLAGLVLRAAAARGGDDDRARNHRAPAASFR